MNRSERTYVIAEAGVNHNGSLSMAKELIDVAAEAGADAVKFQTFTASALVTRFAPRARYQVANTGTTESQFEMVRKLELGVPEHLALLEHCQKREVDFLSTPFDLASLNLLASTLCVARLKISSGDLTNAPLLLCAARSGRPIILSTGMATLGEIETALGVLAFGYLGSSVPPSVAAFRDAWLSEQGRKLLEERVVLLHCTTEYPAPHDDINLRTMDTLAAAFGLRVGFSDHSAGIAVAIAAVARGAAIVEKHFTLDRSLPGPDHVASLEPHELREMVVGIRQTVQALGGTLKIPTVSELNNREVARKSLVALREIKKGEPFSEDNLGVKRPGNGVSPLYYWERLGVPAERNYLPDELVEQ